MRKGMLGLAGLCVLVTGLANASYCGIEVKLNKVLADNEYLYLETPHNVYNLGFGIGLYLPFTGKVIGLQKGTDPDGIHYFYDVASGEKQAVLMVMRGSYSISDKTTVQLVEDTTLMLTVNINSAPASPQAPNAMRSSDPNTINLTINLHHDYDEDGLDTQEEMDHSTADFMPDTDLDFLGDLVDAHGTNIAIAIVGRPVTNICTLGTDPNSPDSDNDGVLDGEEVYGLTRQNGSPGFVTNLKNPDTDG